MGIKTKEAFAFIYALAFAITTANAQPLVPALIAFGDSAVDVGNNNYIRTFFKANHPPYGRDFTGHQATGRFCNGKLATDFTADILGFASYPPAYLSPQASGKNLLTGANFGSAGAGYDEKTSFINQAISLSQQFKYFKEYQNKLEKVTGKIQAASIIRDALYVMGAGDADFLQNYYFNPKLNKVYTPAQYSSYLVSIFSNFLKELYGLGARRIGVISLSPLGCLPAVRTLFGSHQCGCVAKMNIDAQEFNKKLNSTASHLQKQLPGLKLAVFDIFKPLYDVVNFPSKHGFTEASRGCCRTGTVGKTVFLCNLKSPGTCRNATQYVFWDGVHPTEAANQV
ncbi:hypothetical protein ACH5RR_024441 [Cinchona calisaya]|uniref:GDSL esterase/lipase APG n=1 Tax=Cinchona calisaya TaxID=153742 RepID=A0ABD2YWN7_9GENT